MIAADFRSRNNVPYAARNILADLTNSKQLDGSIPAQ